MIQQLNVVPFVSVDHMMKLVHAIGIERMLSEIAVYIEDDSGAGRSSTRRHASPRTASKA